MGQAARRIAVGIPSRPGAVFPALSTALRTVSGVIEGKSTARGATVGESGGISSVIAAFVSKLRSRMSRFPEMSAVRLIEGFYESEKGGLR